MDLVMINQLPELAIARTRPTTQQTTTMTAPVKEKRNPYLSKWHALFDNTSEQWISFQPKVGKIAYPCYACRDMFANRCSFMDHINRRGLVLKYYCQSCDKYLIFYNTCSFLLHGRDHFSPKSAGIDLANVDISIISMDIAGFLPHPDFPRIFDVEETPPVYNLNVDVKFYKPKDECKGNRIVRFEPNELIFYCTVRNEDGVEEIQSMMLCQVCKEIPKCEFVEVVAQSKKNKCNVRTVIQKNITVNKTTVSTNSTNGNRNGVSHSENDDNDDILSIHTVPDEVICLDDVSDGENEEIEMLANVVAKTNGGLHLKDINLLVNNPKSTSPPLKRIKMDNQVPHCQECDMEQISSMKDHFQCNDKPINDEIRCVKCQLILPSPCSLHAHIRIHDKKPPFVCPECGKDFNEWSLLFSHMEDVCFHLAKHVRYKCPAKKCGKIFAQTATFSTHFPLQHIAVRFTCDVCAETFQSEQIFLAHSSIHTFPKALSVTSYECLICKSLFDTVEDHVREHCLDRDNRIYVYTCKYCKSYYRSKNTYAAHLLRCAKLLLNSQVKKEAVIDTPDVQCKVVRFCKRCMSKIQFNCNYKDIKSIGKTCPQCNTDFDTINDETNSDKGMLIEHQDQPGVDSCLLCNKQLNSHVVHKCKFAKPFVNLGKRITIPIYPTENSSPTLSENNSPKRKRKKYLSPSKYKNCPILTVDETIEPILFTGEYTCRVCEFKNISRDVFHLHIKTHRDVSTVFQCMECGECFVVKPSLIKHLLLLHQIENVDSYFEENECFDKEAVKELQDNMRMMPGETREPVAENQCQICRQLFTDQNELSKHFRSHGMAFLMKNIITK